MPKTALVTGAGSGLGRGFALSLARRGYQLCLVGRDLNRLQAVASEISALIGPAPIIYCVDLADADARTRLIENLLAASHPFDLLIQNAARMPAGDFLQNSPAEIGTTFTLNLLAPAEITRCLCAAAIPPAGVIFVLSTAARFPQLYNSLYSASKAGLRFLAEALQVEFAGRTRICLAYPPLLVTAMTQAFDSAAWPLGKADPLRVAERIIAAYFAGKNEIRRFDWERLPDLLYRLAPGVFRWVLMQNRQALRQALNPSNTQPK